jgi:hypothetical protein
MATKKQIQALADAHNIRVAFECGTVDGEFGGETRLTLPEGKTITGGATGYTVIADESTYSQHLSAVMADLKDLIAQM